MHELEGFISSEFLVFSLSVNHHILGAHVHCVCLCVCAWRVCLRAAQTGFYLRAHTWADFGESRHANRTAKAALTPMWPRPESPVSLRSTRCCTELLLPACLPACCPLPGTYTPHTGASALLHFPLFLFIQSTRSCQSCLSTSIQPSRFIASIRIIWPTPHLYSTNSAFTETSLHPPPAFPFHQHDRISTKELFQHQHCFESSSSFDI